MLCIDAKKEGGDLGEPAARLVSVFNDGSGDVGFGEYTGFALPKVSAPHVQTP